MTNQQLVPVNGTQQLSTTNPLLTLPAGMDIIRLGTYLKASGYFKDIRDEAQAIVKILYGAELGISPISSVMGVHIIEGKPAYSGNIMATAIKKARPAHDYRIREHSDAACRIEFFEYGESVGMAEFTIQQANRAGLTGKDVWKRYPEAMLFNRAISAGFRLYCPDLSGGAPAYTPEELGADVDAQGDVIRVTDTEPEQQSDGDKEARWAFIRAGVAKGHYTLNEKTRKKDPDMPAMHAAIGLPRERGALAAWAARFSYDVARQLIEDGLTVRDFYAEQGIADPFAEPEDVLGPDVLPEDGDEPLSQAGLDLGDAPHGDPADVRRKR